MPEQITYDAEHKIIRVVSVGQISAAEWDASLAIVQALHQQHACSKLLVDISRQEGTPGTLGLLKFGEDLPEQLSYAVLNPADMPRGHQFLRAVGLSHGKLISFFHREQDALEWLAELPEKSAPLNPP